MGATCKISTCEKRHQEFASMYVMAENFFHCLDVDGLPYVTDIPNDSKKMASFMDSFTRSQKAVLLYNSNNFPPFWLLYLCI